MIYENLDWPNGIALHGGDLYIAEHQRIISFRNILIHGYAEIDDRLVWDILQSKLPNLLKQVQSLLVEG